jgi:hypothetical protein
MEAGTLCFKANTFLLHSFDMIITSNKESPDACAMPQEARISRCMCNASRSNKDTSTVS